MEEQQQSTPMDMQQTLNTLVTQMAKLDAKMDANIAELTASIGNSNVEFKAGKAELISKLYSARVRSFEFLFARALANKQAAERCAKREREAAKLRRMQFATRVALFEYRFIRALAN